MGGVSEVTRPVLLGPGSTAGASGALAPLNPASALNLRGADLLKGCFARFWLCCKYASGVLASFDPVTRLKAGCVAVLHMCQRDQT